MRFFFPFFLARKYLLSRKSTHIINIITGISVGGLTIGTTAIILVLSVFNGFESLLFDLFSNFNPDIEVSASKGKNFSPTDSLIDYLNGVEGVSGISSVLEETALFEYKGARTFGTIKGVDSNYVKTSLLPTTIRYGEFKLEDESAFLAVIGSGIAFDLSIDIDDAFTPIRVFMPKRNARTSDPSPFITKFIYPAAIFSFQQDYDNEFVLTDLSVVRDLLGAPTAVSGVEIKVDSLHSSTKVARELSSVIGKGFVTKTRYQQDESFYKIMNSEKWVAYAIMSLMLLLIGFTTIGALWMFVLDKQKDIAVLKAMGADKSMIRNLFLLEGFLICLFGLFFGVILAIILYFIQVNFGIISVPDRFLVDAYPIELRLNDFIVVSLTVITLGILTAILPSIRATQISEKIKQE